MPYPNEHAARLKDPGAYKRFRRENDKFGAGIHAIWGVRRDNDKVELQAIRFDKAKFTVAQAKAWLREHDYSPIRFEPASSSSEALGPGDVGRRIFGVKIDPEQVTNQGQFEGYASVFGVVDSYDEVVDRGAFLDTLAEHGNAGTRPSMLWQHERKQPIGVWLDITETEIGLYVRGQLALDEDPRNEVRQAREAYKLMKMKALDGLSIGYRVVDAAPQLEDGKEIVHLKKLGLLEVSPVTFPANSRARIGTVKSVRDVENILRDAGVSRKQAKALASHGYQGLQRRDAAEEPEIEMAGDATDEVIERLRSLINTIRGKE